MSDLPRLADVATVTMGTSPKGTSYNNDGEGLPLLNGPTEFGPSHPLCTLFTTQSKKECQTGDLIFCVRGSTTGRMNWADRVYSLGRGVCSIRGETQLDTKYLKYCIQCHLDALLMLAGGATMPNLTQDTIKSFTIPFPKTRRKIASILSAYDDLIENNTRRIAILEEMAQAIYREWFVHFRFPGHTHVKLVDSPLGPIPEGWEVTNLGAISENFDRLRKPLSKMQRADMKGQYPYYGASKIFDYIDDYIFDGKYLLIGEDGSVITPDRKPVLQLAYDKFWVNNHTHVLRGIAPVSTDFLFLALSDTDVSPYVTGAAQPKINQRNLNSIPMRVGDIELMQRFDEMVNPCIKAMRTLHRKNENLRTTRDLLLPKLISGKLGVEDLDIDVGLTTEALEEATA